MTNKNTDSASYPSFSGQHEYSTPKPCCLQKHSVSVQRALRLQADLSSQFQAEMDKVIQSVIESLTITPQYRYAGIDYISFHETQGDSRILLFAFPLENNPEGIAAGGLMRFENNIPNLFLDLCFGAPRLSPESAYLPKDQESAPPKAAQYLMQKLVNCLADAWCRNWFPFLGISSTGAQWLRQSSYGSQLEQDYIVSRFNVSFILPEDEDPPPQPFVEFCMPVNPLCDGLFRHSTREHSVANAKNAEELIIHRVMSAPLIVTAELLCGSFPISRINCLRPGDILPVSTPDTAHFKVGRTTFLLASVGQQSQKLAFRVIGPPDTRSSFTQSKALHMSQPKDTETSDAPSNANAFQSLAPDPEHHPGAACTSQHAFSPKEGAEEAVPPASGNTSGLNNAEPASRQSAQETLSENTKENRPESIVNFSLEEHSSLGSIPVTLTLQVGNKEMAVSEVVRLKPGSIVLFDQREADPLDICVNGTLIARGEVVLIGECYGLRVLEIL